MKISKINSINNKLPISFSQKTLEKEIYYIVPKKENLKQYASENVKANFIPSVGGLYSNYGMDNFLKLLERTQVNGQSLLSQLEDRSFETDENFDISEWVNFLTLFDIKSGDDKTYLEKFLSKTTFSDFFYSKDFSPTDVIELINDLRKPINHNDFKKLFDIIGLISDVDSSKYDAEERVKSLRYFVDLKDENGKKIFDVGNPRLSKLSTYRFLMDIDPTSVNSSNLQMLLELVSQGIVGNHIFEFLPKEGNFSPLVIEDIDKLYNAYSEGIDPIDAFIPTYNSKEQAQQKLSVGDVYELEGEDDVYIIDNENKSSKLNMTKQKYFELFPPIERFSTTQNQIGNCWEISVLQGMYANPQTRHILLSMFSEQGKDLIVKYPNGVNGDVLFENGELPNGEDLDSYSQGAKGFQLLEYADGKEVQSSKIRQYRLYLVSLAMKNPKLAAIKRDRFEDMINLYGAENLQIEYDQSEKEWNIGVFRKSPYGYNNAEVMGRDGGSPLDFLIRLGFETIDEFTFDEDDEFLLNPRNFESNIVILTTKNYEFLPDGKNMADRHAYFVRSANVDENGNVVSFNILNPWGMTEQKLTLEELKKYGAAITYGCNLSTPQNNISKGEISNIVEIENFDAKNLKQQIEKLNHYVSSIGFSQIPNYDASYFGYVPNILIARSQPNMKEFFDFLDEIEVNGKSLTKYIKDFRFAFNPNFDKEAWMHFLSEMNDSVAIMDSTEEEKTFLSKVLELYSISELLNSKSFKPTKAIDFLDIYYDRPDEEISAFPFSAQLDFMINAASSDRNLEDYVDDMFYFLQVEDKLGNRILSERAGQMDRTQVDVLKYMLNIDKGSVDASNVQMLLELVQNGVVGEHVFDSIPWNGKINSFIIEDIDKLYQAYIQGVDPIDAFVPTFKTKEQAVSSLRIGDVFELEGQEYIYILDKNKSVVPLKMDKETYFELFPPIERYAGTQNDIGNCWEITGFNTILCDPEERVSILNLYEQDGDDILISFPAQKAKKIHFEGGELPSYTNLRYYTKGSKGMQLFEYAHAIEMHEEQIETLKQQIQYAIDNAKTSERKKELQEKLETLQEMLDENRENVYITLNPQTFEWSFELLEKDANEFENAVMATRDGGDPITLFKRLEYPTANIKDNDLQIYELISNPQNFEDYIIAFGTKDDDFLFPKNSPLLKDHSYRIYPTKVDVTTGKVTDLKLIDPAGIIEIPMNIMELRKYGGIYSVARRDKTDKSKISFKGNSKIYTLSKSQKFKYFLNDVQSDNSSLLKQINDFSFLKDKNFDYDSWFTFLSIFSKSKVLHKEKEKSLLDAFLSENSITINELINSGEFNPKKVVEFLDRYYNSISDKSESDKIGLMQLLLDVGMSSCSVDEYWANLNYFRNLKTLSGNEIFLGSGSKNRNVFRYLLNLNPSSVEASNIEMLIDLIKNEVVDRHILEFLPQKGTIQPLIIEDIEKLYQAYIEGVKPIDVFVPYFESIEDAQNSLEIGDVFETDEEFIYIIDRNKQAVQLSKNQ